MLSPLCSLWPLLAALLLGWLLCGWFARQFLRGRDASGAMNTSSAVSPAWTSFQRVYWTIAVIFAFLLLVSWVAGFGPGGRACKIAGMAASSMSAPRAAPAPAVAAEAPKAAPAVAAAPTPAAPSTLPPAAKLYFPPDKTTLPPDTVRTLLPVVTYLQANGSAKASISGFHDSTGKKARNEALALDRARAARGALERAGIARERIVLQKPAVTSGGGAAREARRVEVVVQMP